MSCIYSTEQQGFRYHEESIMIKFKYHHQQIYLHAPMSILSMSIENLHLTAPPNKQIIC